jgi:hypothetical protein
VDLLPYGCCGLHITFAAQHNVNSQQNTFATKRRQNGDKRHKKLKEISKRLVLGPVLLLINTQKFLNFFLFWNSCRRCRWVWIAFERGTMVTNKNEPRIHTCPRRRAYGRPLGLYLRDSSQPPLLPRHLPLHPLLLHTAHLNLSPPLIMSSSPERNGNQWWMLEVNRQTMATCRLQPLRRAPRPRLPSVRRSSQRRSLSQPPSYQPHISSQS